MGCRSLVALALLFAAGLSAAADRPPSRTFTYGLLADDALGYVVMGAKAVERDPALGPDALDVAAAVLAERSAKPSASAVEIDASAWLIRALGAGGRARHRPVVEQAMAAYRHKKIDKYAEAALAAMHAVDTGPAGPVDLAALRAELQAEREAMPASNPGVATYAPGTTLDTVLRDQGFPERTSETVKRAGYRYVQVAMHAVRLHYPHLGMVDIGLDPATSGWVVKRFWPKLGDAYAGDHPFEAMALVNGDDRELLDVAMGLVDAGVREPQLLDVAAARIRQSMGSRYDHEVKALAYLCRLLGASGDRRHLEVLQLAADYGMDPALRRHARRGVETLQASP